MFRGRSRRLLQRHLRKQPFRKSTSMPKARHVNN
jgi:hypothetical protein